MIPEKLKKQIVHVFKKLEKLTFDNESYTSLFETIHDELASDIGELKLPYTVSDGERLMGGLDSSLYKVQTYFLETTNDAASIHVINVVLKTIQECIDNTDEHKKELIDLIQEVNKRFKESGVGYCFEEGQIIRIDSLFAHEEIIKPALVLLSNAKYKGAQEEFLRAHEHYRHNRNMEALVDCLKSFESTMKTIISKNKWKLPKNKNETVSVLVNVCLQNNLIPEHQENYLSGLANILINSTATFRNKDAGHGQGADVKEVPAYIVSHLLNVTASTIILFIKAEEKLHE